MRQIVKNVNLLRDKDELSKILFFIYKLSECPEYSYISELIYAMDKKSLINFCSIFGGCTIKVPTTEELEYYFKVLLIYQLVSDGMSYLDACNEAGIKPNEPKLKSMFNKIRELESIYEKDSTD